MCDLQVLCHLSVLSVCKIFGYFHDIGTHEIVELTSDLPENSKIDLATMLEFCIHHKSIGLFLHTCERLSAANQEHQEN